MPPPPRPAWSGRNSSTMKLRPAKVLMERVGKRFTRCPLVAAWLFVLWPPLAVGAAEAPPYAIGPADVLQITVWKEPDLTREVTVRFDGMVTVPLVGDVQAAGQARARDAKIIA